MSRRILPSKREALEQSRAALDFYADSAGVDRTPFTITMKPKVSRGKSSIPLESAEMRAYFKWVWHVTINGAPLRPHVYHVPNGGRRDAIEGAHLRAQGMTLGVPDISVDVPAGGYHGLRIEMKRQGDNTPSEAQADQLAARRSMGYAAETCGGWVEARVITINYLRMTYRINDSGSL